MPRFQSRLFNWIDRSLPVQLGRSARRSLDQKIQQLTGLSLQELPRLLAYQAAKAVLYPVYLIASTVKRNFPALDRSKVEAKEKLRSQPDSVGLLAESENKNDFPKLELPLLLRPLAKFLNWIDRTKIRLDRNIAAIIKRQPDNLATSDSSQLDSKLIANRIFAEIWQQQVEQGQGSQSSLKGSNRLTENVSLDKDTKLEQLRSLIEAAIAYFFGKQRSQPTLDETSDITVSEKFPLTMADIFSNDNGPWPLSAEHESIAFSKSPDRNIIHSSGELQNFETTTTQISQDRLDGSLVFIEELLGIQQKISEIKSDRPLRAWIEVNATILGYVYNPVMTVVLWIDTIVLKIEDLMIGFWQGLINFPKRLIYFIRYGKSQ
ncbi:MAG: hypothetical protein LH649_11000 [Pseudanabaena sp. CAN_BIN31]|nr:hypothetical protein [Pseudanabaena sp. CAN_BIN31]